MSTHNIPFLIYIKKSASIIPNMQLLVFSKGLKDEFETTVVNEPSVFQPLDFYCNDKHINDRTEQNRILLRLKHKTAYRL